MINMYDIIPMYRISIVMYKMVLERYFKNFHKVCNHLNKHVVFLRGMGIISDFTYFVE